MIEFRDLKRQYLYLKKNIDDKINDVIQSASFIGGKQVNILEQTLANYVDVKHCISCANGTDALELALMVWNIGFGDAVFVPDFTFFSTGEVVAAVGATPIFVDVRPDTFNMDTVSLEGLIRMVKTQGKLKPRAIIAVDLFGQPAEYDKIKQIATRNNLYLLEDCAQGFGGSIDKRKACSFGDISTTSFFPAKPLGCYGDGGAIFTNSDEWAKKLTSLKVHGKGLNKYDNVYIGMNSRLDSIQAAILNAKFPVFINEEMNKVQLIARTYTSLLNNYVKTPLILDGFNSSWAQYSIQLESNEERDRLQSYLKEQGIPSMVYYQKPMHCQKAFGESVFKYDELNMTTNRLCSTILSLPFHPYLNSDEIEFVCDRVKEFFQRK
ncbi:DegT/DnrJ/EryC1/StrS family aminotransferase [Butyrivibrio fibrisolvens]|uniref:DegT/DnrJ/EryC1/StrS family aminotransferase n=1 Tax=Butyrivibrio fibrisolvens TaxID=831 RepID=UPI0003F8AA22|nr:DegT/DnrJ/EryC1/StrS family aminotransferase [Butyrivibrio fibrisolvens]